MGAKVHRKRVNSENRRLLHGRKAVWLLVRYVSLLLPFPLALPTHLATANGLSNMHHYLYQSPWYRQVMDDEYLMIGPLAITQQPRGTEIHEHLFIDILKKLTLDIDDGR